MNHFPPQGRPPGETPIVERKRAAVREVVNHFGAGTRCKRRPLDSVSFHEPERDGDALEQWTPLFTIASNTGCTSVGELLMTCRISAVAVCCSSASFVSLKSRAFWIAITAWSANVFSSAISFSENSPTTSRPTKDHAYASTLP